jgi:NADH dehydrogenase (ubiquinone) flavoprotein 2
MINTLYKLSFKSTSLFNFFAKSTTKQINYKYNYKKFSTVYVNHKDTEDNNQQAPFDFTIENYKEVDIILSRYPKNQKKSAIMPLLWLAQKQNHNHITLQAMQKIAKICEVPDMAVYEVASFYTMYNRFPVGKFHLQICGTTPCMIRGAKAVIDSAMQNAGVKHLGEVSKDGMFCVSEVECLGACVNAPMMQVNNEWFYEDLTSESINNIMNQWRDGKEPKVGPQINRNMSEGPLGRTSLSREFSSKPIDRNFQQAKADWEAAKVKIDTSKK